MPRVRLIARLDIKGQDLITGVHTAGPRVIGDPHAYATRYYRAGIDELLFMDAVAGLYGRNGLAEILRRAAKDVFVPMTAGGGVGSLDDAWDLLRAGADKVAVNSAALARPELITEMAHRFGRQSVVLSIEARRSERGGWAACSGPGRPAGGRDVVAWAREGAERGAGEILLTSLDRRGTATGFESDLTRAVAEAVGIPVIASGGMGAPEHLVDVVSAGQADAAAMSDILHHEGASLDRIRAAGRKAGFEMREAA